MSSDLAAIFFRFRVRVPPGKSRFVNTLQLSDLTLEDLLPHRGNMLLIDEVLEVTRTYAVTRSVARKSWPLADEEGVHSLVLVELAAQAAGVCNGWDRIITQGLDSDQMGYLVGIKRARFYVERIFFDKAVIARAENTYNFENLREIFCALHLDDRVIAEITLQLFQA